MRALPTDPLPGPSATAMTSDTLPAEFTSLDLPTAHLSDAITAGTTGAANAPDAHSIAQHLPLLSTLPERIGGVSLGYFAVTLGMMMLLAALDGVGAVFAKEWTERQQPWLFIAGLLCFVVLYVVYANSLRIAELSIVTLGWIVFLQVGLLLVDVLRYDLHLTPGKWGAIAVMLVLQGYILFSPNSA